TTLFRSKSSLEKPSNSFIAASILALSSEGCLANISATFVSLVRLEASCAWETKLTLNNNVIIYIVFLIVFIVLYYIVQGPLMGWFINLLAPSSSINRCFSESNFNDLFKRRAIKPKFTTVQDLWPFDSLRANFFRVFTASTKSVTCGSGSGNSASFLSKSGISETKPL